MTMETMENLAQCPEDKKWQKSYHSDFITFLSKTLGKSESETTATFSLKSTHGILVVKFQPVPCA